MSLRVLFLSFLGSIFMLVLNSNAFGQYRNNRDTLFTDSTLNEIIAIKYTATGFGGGNGGGSSRIRMISFTIKDTLGTVIHSGFIYKQQNGCLAKYPYSLIYSYNADSSFDVTTMEEKMFRVKRRTHHFRRYVDSPKTKKRKEIIEQQGNVLNKITCLVGN